MKVLLIILASLLNSRITVAEENKIFLYNRIESCKADDYFDINYFKCVPCDSNLNLIVADDYLTCTCNKNTTAIIEYDNSSKQPLCQANKSTEAITTCTIKYVQQSQSNVQSKIVQIFKAGDRNCTCNAKTNFFFRNEYCIPKYLLKEFTNYANVQPNTIYKDLNFITFFCQVMKDGNFCNQLANLCVLSNYNLEKNSPCSLFFTSQTSIVSDGNEFKMTPFLFYKKGKDSVDETDKVLDHQYSVDENDVKNRIQMLLVAFHVNGSLRTIQRLEVNDLNFCDESTIHYTHIKFAENFQKTCSVNLNRLIGAHDVPLLYDLYLNYTENNLNLLKSVPVLIRNAFAHNTENNREKWQLVKRFFLLDTYTDPNSTFRRHKYNDRNLLQRFQSLRFAKDVELIFTLNNDHSTYPNRISVPVLKVIYGEVNITNLNRDHSFTNVYVDFEIKIKFVKSYEFGSIFDIVMSPLMVTAFLFSLFRAYCYKTRQQRQFYDVDIFFKFVIFVCSNIGNALFIYVTFISVYTLIVVRTQSIVKILLPIHEQDMIDVFIYVAVALKTISIVHLIWQQSHIDIFLIDWERPKVFDHHPRYHLDTPSISSSSKQLSYDGVSAWRNYFIANEWLKMTTKRKFCFLLHIVVVLFSVVMLNLEHPLLDACSMDDTHKQVDFHDKTLQIAWGIIIFTSAYLSQRLINFFCHERYVNNTVQQFVDVCSMANVSVFILKHETFGYYIHGRSPHGFSDTDMCSMILQLKREEDNICGHRGLLPSSEQQTYSFQTPRNLRVLFDKMITPLQNMLKNGPESHTLDLGHKIYEQSLEKTASVYYNINRFLSAFIDHGLKDLEYIVQEKSFIETVLGFEFSSNGPDTRGVFYLDSGHSFDDVLFYGNDFVLFQYEAMVFIWIFVMTNSFVAGILGVAGIQQVLCYITRLGEKWNLSRKTLIDRQFLL